MTLRLDEKGLNNKYLNIIDLFFILVYGFIFSIGFMLLKNYPPLVWVDIIMDDAYYYLGVVRNIVENNTSSYNQPFQTNGYQPLWVLVLSVSAWIFGTDENSLVLQNYVINYLFIFAFIVLSRLRYGLAFPAVICSISYAHIVLNGMEVAMLPAFFILFITAVSWKARGLFGALLFLTRLDALAVVIIRDAYYFLIKKNSDFKHYLIIVPVIISYCIFNYVFFGIPLPVSGLQKAVGNIMGENILAVFQYILTLKTALRLIVVVGFVFVINHQKVRTLRFYDEYIILLLSVVCCAGYYTVKSGWPVWEWYFWGSFLLIYYPLLESALAINNVFIWNLKFSKYIYAFLLVFSIAYTIKPSMAMVTERFNWLSSAHDSAALDASYGRKNLELVALIKRSGIPENSFFAMGDRAGSFGFFLGNHYRFFHAEGLVANADYYQAMRKDEGLNFVNSLDLDYWVAERENFLENDNILGVIEPVQGMSAHLGPYMVCFPKNAILFDQSYVPNKYSKLQKFEYRYTFKVKNKVNCPTDMLKKFYQLRNQYEGVRKFSLPIEYSN